MDQLSVYLSYAPVASAIFAITIVCSLMAFYNDDIYDKFILQPYSVARNERVYTLFTSGLIHGDWQHLIFNMMSYWFFAFQLEAILGHWQFGLLYLVSLAASDVPTVIKHKNDYWYRGLGASGAISAVVFSFIMFFPLSKMGIIFIPIPIPAILFGGLYLLYCVVASKQRIGNVNHDAHFYGALCGVVITILLNPQVVLIFAHQLSKAG